MKLLLYCIIHHDPAGYPDCRTGVNGSALQFVVEDRLAAVLTEVDRPEALFTVEAATAYHGVITQLHEQRTVIPFRLGTLFDRISDVQDLLRTRHDRFVEMLRGLDGCVEMGLKVLVDLNSLNERSVGEGHGSMPATARFDDGSPGTAYLLRRQSHYSSDLMLQEITRRTVEEYASHLGSLCTRVTYERARECAHNGVPRAMISAYFLMPRAKEEDFRHAFHALDDEMRSRTLLTGPWPPYNFVVPIDGHETACTSPQRVCETPSSQVLNNLAKTRE